MLVMSTCSQSCSNRNSESGCARVIRSRKASAPSARISVSGILAVGQKQEADRLSTGCRRQRCFQCLPSRGTPGAIAVEAEHHLGGRAREQLQMLGGRGGAEGRNDVGHPELRQGDDIHVAFDDEDRFELAVGLLRLEQTVKLAPLWKIGVSGEFRYFGLPSPSSRPPKADHASSPIPNREGDAIAKAVAPPPLLVEDQTAAQQRSRSAGLYRGETAAAVLRAGQSRARTVPRRRP
jgi:hypothetical protein